MSLSRGRPGRAGARAGADAPSGRGASGSGPGTGPDHEVAAVPEEEFEPGADGGVDEAFEQAFEPDDAPAGPRAPGLWPVLAAVFSAALAALFGVLSTDSAQLVGIGCAGTALILAAGWPFLVDLPHPRGTAAVVLGVGWAAVAVVALGAPAASPPLAALAEVLALALLAGFGHELLRRPPRRNLVESAAGTFCGSLLAALCAGWVLLPGLPHGRGGLVAAATAVAVTRVVGVLPVPWAGWAAAAAGTVVGLVTATVVGGAGPAGGIAAAALSAVLVALLDRLLAGLPGARTPAALPALVAAPICAAGGAALVTAWLATR